MSFILNKLNDFKPSDESLKQGRNRSWQAVPHPQHPQHPTPSRTFELFETQHPQFTC